MTARYRAPSDLLPWAAVGGGADLAGRVTDAVTEIAERGYVILERVIDDDLVDALARRLGELERFFEVRPAGNPFEGARTLRLYNLLAFGEPWDRVPVHEAVLPVVEGVLDPGCLVSSLSSITILPGERAQPLHADDQLIPLPKPHPPVVCNTMWALTDFTADNGATRVVPGSHLYTENPVFGQEYETVPAEMPRGSVLVWHGSLWHGGGANRTREPRVGIAMNYCAGFIRQQENQQLGVPREVAARFGPRLRALLGYGVYNGLIGHINKRSPAELLDAPAPGVGSSPMVWDALRAGTAGGDPR